MDITEPVEHQLIVLGNGFDLACDLPSRYEDFFGDIDNMVYPSPEELGQQSWGMYLRDHRYTAWDVIFCYARRTLGKNWHDIEDHISRWVKNGGAASSSRIDRILAALQGVVQNFPGMYGVPDDWRTYDGMRLLERYPEVEVARFLMDVYSDDVVGSWNRSKLLDVLLEELHSLEKRFVSYLNDAIDSTPRYVESAVGLLESIRSDRFSADDSRYHSTVLNFNYTTPYEYCLDPHNDLVNPLNIHGRLDDEIVFGIDGSDCMSDAMALPFTKTYRIMSMGMDDVIDIVFPPGSTCGWETMTMKFFGHSLSKPDYSYFQALFDSVDIYSGHVTLVFYYRPYGAGDDHTREVRCRESMMSAVIKLLVEYGKTLDNKNHGRNLIHKLLLEGRLHVTRI